MSWRSWWSLRFPLRLLLGPRFYVPNNLNVGYMFGALLLGFLILQLISGLWLAFFYQPTIEQAYASIENIMRQVPYGWLIRYTHTTGASALFALLYLHMMRGLLYRSYQSPRELVWILGVVLLWLMLAEGFSGYLLPWGQMSYWGATVVTDLLSTLPHGDQWVQWIRGDYHVSQATLSRFYAVHTIALPLFFIFIIRLHLQALHQVGSGNPQQLNIDTRSRYGEMPPSCIPFFPRHALKEGILFTLALLLFFAVVFFAPQGFGYFMDPCNEIPANPLTTPAEIKPLWYMAPFYSLLRAIPAKNLGALALFGSLFIWCLLPWLDAFSLKTKNTWRQWVVGLWALCFLGLIYQGLSPISSQKIDVIQILSAAYFLGLIFMVLL